MQQNNYPNQMPKQPMQQPLPPPPVKPQYQFRWELFVGIPFAVMVFIWLVKNIRLSFDFDDIVGLLGIRHADNYARFVGLAVLCLAFIVVVKLFRKRPVP